MTVKHPFDISRDGMGASRIDVRQAMELYSGSFHQMMKQAAAIVERYHPQKVRTYVIERNINYTNVCCCRCSFCAFSVSPKDADAYVLTIDHISAKIEALQELGGNQILLQGGMHPELTLGWYEELLGKIRRRFGDLHIHAFSPPEIVFLAERSDLEVEEVIGRLQEAGLDSIPGGGAEILVDRVRKIISPGKCTTEQWLDVMRQAHRLGLCTTATMMFGHVETPAERIEHLDRVRRLQDESLDAMEKTGRGGCFTAFTCWPFQGGHTRLAKQIENDSAGAFEYLKANALARIMLDNIPNIQSSWVTQGPKIAQMSLSAGCNDLGSLMMEENVVSAAGTSFDVSLEMMKQLIETAGYSPVRRDYYYRPFGGD